MNFLFYGIEIGVALLFLLVLYYAIQKRHNLEILILSVVYAFIFETVNILLLSGRSGSYVFNPEFFLLFGTPIFVLLSWAIIFYSSFEISDTLPIPNKFKFLSNNFLYEMDLFLNRL